MHKEFSLVKVIEIKSRVVALLAREVGDVGERPLFSLPEAFQPLGTSIVFSKSRKQHVAFLSPLKVFQIENFYT